MIAPVHYVQFGIADPSSLRAMSVMQATTQNGRRIEPGVTTAETYVDGAPVWGGVSDPRLGTLEYRQRCKTCDCSYSGVGGAGPAAPDCPGHFGHVEMARPVYHLGYLKETIMVLRCVCHSCSKLLIDRSDDWRPGAKY